MTEEYFKDRIRSIPDFPKKGILFRDITTLIGDPEAFREAIDTIYEECCDLAVTKVMSVESRGFIFGSALAYKLGCGFVPVRKPGKLPSKTLKKTYSLEYGNDALEVHADALSRDERVLVVDDLLATGGTLRATCDLVEDLGASVAGIAVLLELTSLGGRDRLSEYNLFSLAEYDSETI